MPRIRAILSCAALALAALAPAATGTAAVPEAASSIIGTWRNPMGTVQVRTSACGEQLCGWVVWASPEALQDARDSGIPNLVGTMLLQDYRRQTATRWQGRVFVPDMGGTFYSRIDLLGPASIKVSGCILHGLLCKSQVWQRA